MRGAPESGAIQSCVGRMQCREQSHRREPSGPAPLSVHRSKAVPRCQSTPRAEQTPGPRPAATLPKTTYPSRPSLPKTRRQQTALSRKRIAHYQFLAPFHGLSDGGEGSGAVAAAAGGKLRTPSRSWNSGLHRQTRAVRPAQRQSRLRQCEGQRSCIGGQPYCESPPFSASAPPWGDL